MSPEINLWIKKIFVVLAFIVALYGAWLLRSMLVVLLIAGFFTILVNPLINIGERHKIHAGFTLIGVYIAVFFVMGMVIGTLIPIVINYLKMSSAAIINWITVVQYTYETSGIEGLHLNQYLERALLFVLGQENLQHTLDIIKQNAGSIQSFLTNQISSATNGGLSIIGSVGGTVATWGLVLITTFLMVLERKRLGVFLLEIVPEKMGSYLKTHYYAIQEVTTAWIKATLVLSMSIFLATFIGLTIVKLVFGYDTEQSFTLALIAGIMEFIPYVGPLIALIPAVIIGLGIGWQAALTFTVLYLLIQRLENDILVPVVMSRALALSPLLVFVVMIAGGTLGGLLGIILAVPIAGIARVVYEDYISRRFKKKEAAIKVAPPVKKPRSIKRKVIAKV